MRNPVRPPVGFFNRRLSTRQNSSSDKVSKVDTALPLLASTQCDVHFHFYFYIYFHFHFSFCFLFDLASTYTFTFILSYCMNSVLECHFHFLFAFFCFSIYFHFDNQSPRTPNRSASTTDVESHTESDAERVEVALFCFHICFFIIYYETILHQHDQIYLHPPSVSTYILQNLCK